MDEDALAEKFRRLGDEDPEASARAEIEDDVPYLAYSRLTALVRAQLLRRRESMDTWWSNLQRAQERDPGSASARVADIVARCLAAGITLDDLAVLVEDVAQETASGFAYLLADPYDDDLGDPSDLPSWALVELAPEDDGGELTGRSLDGLHEYLGPED